MDRRILVVGLVMVAMVTARPSAKKHFKHALKSKGGGKPDLQALKEQILADIAAGHSEPVTIEELDLTIGAYRTRISDAVPRFQAIREASPGVAIVTKLRDISGDFARDDDEIIRLLYRSFILGFNSQEICKPKTKEYDACRDGQLQAIVKDMLAVWKVLFPKIMQTCDALDKLVEAKEDVSDKAINGAFKKDIGCLKNQYQSVDKYLKSIADTPVSDNEVYDRERKYLAISLLSMKFLDPKVDQVSHSAESLLELDSEMPPDETSEGDLDLKALLRHFVKATLEEEEDGSSMVGQRGQTSKSLSRRKTLDGVMKFAAPKGSNVDFYSSSSHSD